MSAPVTRLSRLSLEEMPPMTRFRARTVPRAASPQYHHGYDTGLDVSSSDCDNISSHGDFIDGEEEGGEGEEEEEEEEEETTLVQSPTRLLYSLEQLSDSRRAAVRETFTEPPKIALQRCRRIGDTYAFQMTELVNRSIRIRASTSGVGGARRGEQDEEDEKKGRRAGERHEVPQLSCSCGQQGDIPCRHLVWLLDQLLKETLYHHDNSKPLNMTDQGFAVEMGDPFQNISEFHLDVLADGLHCQVVDPESYSEDDLDYHRVAEARELLASVYSNAPEDFRPDLFSHPILDDDILKDSDLDCTVFRMLLDNPHFFHYFLSLSRPTDPINDLYRKLSHRVTRVLEELDAFVSSTFKAPSRAKGLDPGDSPYQKNPRNVAWASRHLLGIVGLIRSSIYTRDQPLRPYEALSAVHTLVQILESVVARSKRDTLTGQRSLFSTLIGDRNEADFVITELDLLPEAATHVVDSLEAIVEQIGPLGAPVTYMKRFSNVLGRLRTSSAGAGKKRHVSMEETDRDSKRMK